MNLTSFNIIPGVVIDNNDPKKLGRIKCAAPGVFDNSTMPTEVLPWVYPFCMTGYQTFSKMQIGSKVWVFQNSSSLNEYWYLPMFEFIDITRKYVSDNYDNNPDVLISRMGGAYNSQLVYDDANGFTINTNNSSVKIKPEGEIELKAESGKVLIQSSAVSVGNENDTYEPAVLGNQLYDVLSDLKTAFNTLRTAAKGNPHTMKLVPGFTKCVMALNGIDKILAQNTTLN